MNSFDDFAGAHEWRPIRGCPGRLVRVGEPCPRLDEFVRRNGARHVVPACSDPVWVTVLADGGLLSYEKPDQLLVHTLNTSDGLDRKLRDLALR